MIMVEQDESSGRFAEPSLHWFANDASHFNNIGRLDDRTAISDMRMHLEHSDDQLRLKCTIRHPLLSAEDSDRLTCAFDLSVKVRRKMIQRRSKKKGKKQTKKKQKKCILSFLVTVSTKIN